jgi:hypothetical protein
VSACKVVFCAGRLPLLLDLSSNKTFGVWVIPATSPDGRGADRRPEGEERRTFRRPAARAAKPRDSGLNEGENESLSPGRRPSIRPPRVERALKVGATVDYGSRSLLQVDVCAVEERSSGLD